MIILWKILNGSDFLPIPQYGGERKSNSRTKKRIKKIRDISGIYRRR